MIYSINIIIQVDFTACSGMLQMMIVTLMYILGSRFTRAVALTGGQAQYVGYNTICTKNEPFLGNSLLS